MWCKVAHSLVSAPRRQNVEGSLEAPPFSAGPTSATYTIALATIFGFLGLFAWLASITITFEKYTTEMFQYNDKVIYNQPIQFPKYIPVYRQCYITIVLAEN